MVFLVLFWVIFFLGTPVSLALAADWQEIATGIQAKIFTVPQGDQEIALHALKINPKKAHIKPLFQSQNLTAQAHAQKSGAFAVINANFFDVSGSLLGLLQKNGKVIHPKKNISWWSVFCLKQDLPHIIHSSQYRENVCDEAIQAGPRLIVNGTIPKLKEDLSRKTAVGINRRGEVLLVVTRQALSMNIFAQIMTKPENQGGLGSVAALNLDGGTSSQMYVATNKLALNIPSFMEFPVGLGVFPP